MVSKIDNASESSQAPIPSKHNISSFIGIAELKGARCNDADDISLLHHHRFFAEERSSGGGCFRSSCCY
jgi:hypothetical protein